MLSIPLGLATAMIATASRPSASPQVGCATRWCTGAGSATTKHAFIGIVDNTTVSGLAIQIGKVEKYSGNPLFQQDKPWEPRLDNGYPNVVYDTASGLAGDGPWRLWYGGLGSDEASGQYLYYANSSDGLSWTKPDLNRYDLSEKWSKEPWAHKVGKHNNIIMYGGGLGIYHDLHDPDPTQRYKISGGSPAGCFSDDGSTDCVTATAGSPDGIHNWTRVSPLTFAPPWRPDCHTNLFYDDRHSEYRMTTRDYTSSTGRDIAITTSSIGRGRDGGAVGSVGSAPSGVDMFGNWSSPIIVETGTEDHQLYSQITFPFYDVYLGIVMVYDATNGHVGPTAGHVHCRLAWSGDGLTDWQWVDAKYAWSHDSSAIPEFIPKGELGDFDSHICFAAHVPIRLPDGTVRLYYMGGNGPHSGARNSSFALATLRPDGFASFGGKQGTVQTVAITVTGGTMILSADVAVGGSVTVTAMDTHVPTSAPITSNVTDGTVTFPGGGLGSLVGSSIVFKLTMIDAEVYTLGFIQ
eukprot:m.17866 g.17866  ORF g.17866 m.17866 type:complete len:521 (-) comp3542_c0_seq1:152-1714(-)